MVRADVTVSNIFLARPDGTHFQVNATVTPYTVEDWGDDTIGLLQDNDAVGRTEFNPVILGWHEGRHNLARKFDLKLENKFPRHRFNGNCVLSRIGSKL